jgi:hypothetical protein
VTTKETESEETLTNEIRAAHPKVPGAWSEELTLHRMEARRISVRYLRMKGSTTHDVGEVIVRLDENTDRFKFEHVEDDGTLTEEISTLSAKQVIDHLWAWACEEGLAYASKQRLTKLRGELAIFDERNICLNDPSQSRKVLNLEDPARPFTDDDDNDLDAGIRGELAYERRVNREHTKRFVTLVERIEDRAHAGMKADEMRSEAARNLDARSISFTDAKELWLDKVMEETLGNARVDQLLEFGIEMLTPKGPDIIDAVCVALRNVGNKVDPRQVPDCPDELLFWIMDAHGSADFAAATACHMKARRNAPTAAGFQTCWVDALALLSEALRSGAEQVTPEIAKLSAAWGKSAAGLIQVDPHAFTHLCFCEALPMAATH